MYITKCKALEIPVEFTTYHTKAEIIALIDSGATDNFIDFRTVMKLRLGTKKLPRARQLFNVDGTHNQAGLIEESVHLYVERGDEQIQTQFHVTNLGKDRIILGYPWLEAFNPQIDWRNGKIHGPQTKFKTTTAVSREHEQEAYRLCRLCLGQKERLRKVTIAQQMAEKYYEDHKEETLREIPPEYQQHAQVFSEKEAE
jgi:Retroviral aspartyl protease